MILRLYTISRDRRSRKIVYSLKITEEKCFYYCQNERAVNICFIYRFCFERAIVYKYWLLWGHGWNYRPVMISKPCYHSMVLRSSRAYNFNHAPNIKQSIFVLYTVPVVMVVDKDSRQRFLSSDNMPITAALDNGHSPWQPASTELTMPVAQGNGHSQNYARTFSQSDYRNLYNRYIIKTIAPKWSSDYILFLETEGRGK